MERRRIFCFIWSGIRKSSLGLWDIYVRARLWNEVEEEWDAVLNVFFSFFGGTAN